MLLLVRISAVILIFSVDLLMIIVLLLSCRGSQFRAYRSDTLEAMSCLSQCNLSPPIRAPLGRLVTCAGYAQYPCIKSKSVISTILSGDYFLHLLLVDVFAAG